MSALAELPNVRRANRALETLWRSGLAPRPRLEVETLEAAALRGAPRSAFGPDEEWQTPFEVLLRSLREEADLNSLGLTMAHGQIVMMLRARMRAAKLWRDHPEILDRPITAPVVILGQMRSGTTRLHRLLACDDRFAFTRLHESLIPVPLASRAGERDRRRLRARAGVALLHRLNPALRSIHPTAPSTAEEEFGLVSFGFGAAQFEAQWRVPTFSRWWETADARPLYREFGRLLRTNNWFRAEPSDRLQLLKLPQFLQDLPLVLDAFPGARLICLERDLEAVVASSASLVWNQMRIQSDRAETHWIGREWLRKTRLRQATADAALGAHPNVPRTHLSYDAMNRDWRAEIVCLYAFLDMPLSADVLARMERYMAGARAHAGHRYSLEQFGLSPRHVAQGESAVIPA